MKSFKSNKLKGQILKIFWITVAWTVISAGQFFIAYSALLQFNCDFGNYDPMTFFRGAVYTGIWAGILGGSILVFAWEKWLRSKNYGVALFHMFLSYSLIFLLVAVPNTLLFYSKQSGLPLSEIDNWIPAAAGIFSLGTLQNFIVWLFVILGTLIALQVNDKYGPGVFRSFLLGKYFQPKREERIFMFLDLRSSTTIAEKLGDERYFKFINEVFKDVTPSILYTQGEIYQYVGDEIVISWRTEKGIKNANCVNCFLEIQSTLRRRAKYYEETYDGIKPEFKAGLHYGHVMAGEVGMVKRDIAYSGDVLNTTARIQSKCNEFGVNILLSKFLLDKLALRPHLFTPQKIGDIELRGKRQKMMLYTL